MAEEGPRTERISAGQGDHGRSETATQSTTTFVDRAHEAPALTRCVTWRSAVVVAFATTLLVMVSLGPMAEELGNLSTLVWLVTALIGALQCLLITEFARAFPDRAGGTATYAHEALGQVSPRLSALSSWCYWLAWTPGIAVNLILAAGYIQSAAGLPDRPIEGAVILGVLLYGFNARGLHSSMSLAGVLAVFAAIPLAAITVGLLFQPSLLSWDRLVPLVVPAGDGDTSTGALLLKWAFVGAWSAYGAEMASTVVAEMRDVARTIRKAMLAAAAVGVAGFGLLPILLFLAVDLERMVEDPALAFRPLAQAVLGTWGGEVLVVMLAAGLILGAHAFIVGSSRTIYQMALDGHVPMCLAQVNRFGVPIGSIGCDAAVILAVLLLFGDGVVEIVVAANVAYLVVLVLLPMSYLYLTRPGNRTRMTRPLPGRWRLLALVLLVTNLVVLVLGGAQWGWRGVGSGAGAIALVLSASAIYHRRAEQRVRGSRV